MLYFVRHPPVAKAWQKRCYGQSDPGLSREGRAMIAPLVDELAALKPDIIIHSDMARTRAVAQPLACRLGIKCVAESLWRERHFGAWEGQSWNAIYRATGNAMDGMITDPAGFRPGLNGETTNYLIARVEQALNQLPIAKTIVVIAHGGSIAAACLILRSLPIIEMVAQVPKVGQIVAWPLTSPY
jgi:alpha-ribazole phosphatase